MPQLSLYIDEDTLKKLQREAKKAKKSMSQIAKERLQQSFAEDWRATLDKAFGSIPDIERPEQLRWEDDAPREEL